MRIGVVGSKGFGFVEFCERLFGLSVVAMQQTQVVPDCWVLRIELCCALQRCFRLWDVRQIQLRDAKIELCGGVVLVELDGVLKLLERLIQWRLGAPMTGLSLPGEAVP